MAFQSCTASAQCLELLISSYIRQFIGLNRLSSVGGAVRSLIFKTVHQYAERKHITIGLLGNLRSGKSSLGGRMCYEFNHQHHILIDMQLDHDKNAMYTPRPADEAWSSYFDADEEERVRQMSIHGNMQEVYTMSYVLTMIDTPGHTQYLKNFIRYISQSDVVLVVFAADALIEKAAFANKPSTPNLDKRSFDGYYELLDKLRICHLFEVEQLIIAVNKMDKFNYSQQQFAECKSEIEKILKVVGYAQAKHRFPIIPVSATNGDNILFTSRHANLAWWTHPRDGGYKIELKRTSFKHSAFEVGFTLYDAIESIRVQNIKMYTDNIINVKPFKMSLCNIYDEIVDGMVISGRIENGKIAVGTMIKSIPSGFCGAVKSIQMFHKSCTSASFGDIVGISLQSHLLHPQKGDILVNQNSSMARDYEITRFEALVDVFPSSVKVNKKYRAGTYDKRLKKYRGGFSCLVMTNNGIKCQCQLQHILWKLNKNVKNIKFANGSKHQEKIVRPCLIEANDTAKVVFEPNRAFPLSAMQKIVVIEHHQVVMTGKVTKLHYADEITEDFDVDD